MILYYDRQGRPLTMEQWARLYEQHNMDLYKRVAETQVGPYWVSTVWIGLDMGFSIKGDHVPLIFETMVFGHTKGDDPEGGLGPDIDLDRYATEEDALRGHDAMVTLVRATYQEALVDEPAANPTE